MADPTTPAADIALADVQAAFDGHRFRYRNELALHDGLSAALTQHGIDHQREVTIRGGRIDLIAGTIGIEVKVKGSPDAVAAQLRRYASDDRLAALLLVTTRPIHRCIPRIVSGKPLAIHIIGGLSL